MKPTFSKWDAIALMTLTFVLGVCTSQLWVALHPVAQDGQRVGGVFVVKTPVAYQPTAGQVVYYKEAENLVPISEEAVIDYAREHLTESQQAFNRRYGANITLPYMVFTNRTDKNTYELPGNISLMNMSTFWQDRGNSTYYFRGQVLDMVIDHEFCHHVQYEMGGWPKAGESFCEVFAGIEHNATDCVENNNDAWYCMPYRIELLSDRQGFVDCVIDAARNVLTESELDNCFGEWKR